MLGRMTASASSRLVALESERHRRDVEHSMEASEERYRGLFELAPVPIMVIQPGHLEVNDALLELFGFRDRAELEQAGPISLFEPGDAGRIAELHSAPQAEGSSRLVVQSVGRRADGSTFPVQIEGVRLELEGAPSALIFVTDLSELEAAQAALRKSIEQFKELVDASPMAIISVEIDGVIKSWNPAAERMLGWTESESLGRSRPANVEQRDMLRKIGLAEAPHMRGRIARHWRRDGTPIDVRVSSAQLVDGEGKPDGILLMMEDVTELYGLAAERARLATAIDQSGEFIVITEPDGSIAYVNPAFERLTGYGRDDVIGQNPRILKSGHHNAAFYSAMWATLTGGKTWRGTIVNRRRDGTLFEEDAAISPVFDADSKLTSYIAIKRDVTRERELESELTAGIRAEAAVVAALQGLSPSPRLQDTARAICEQVMALPEVTAAGVMLFLPGERVLSLAGVGPRSMTRRVGRTLVPERGAYFLARSSQGPWAEVRGGEAGERVSSPDVVTGGADVAAYAPIRGDAGLIGLLAIGASGKSAERRTSRYLAATCEFAIVAGALLGPGFPEGPARFAGAAQNPNVGSPTDRKPPLAG